VCRRSRAALPPGLGLGRRLVVALQVGANGGASFSHEVPAVLDGELTQALAQREAEVDVGVLLTSPACYRANPATASSAGDISKMRSASRSARCRRPRNHRGANALFIVARSRAEALHQRRVATTSLTR
jgi:hypothetical protein